MKKRMFLLISLVLTLALVLVACAPAAPAEPAPAPEAPAPEAPAPEAPAPEAPAPEAPAADGEFIEITLINNKVEIDGALRNFAALYEDMFGVRVNIQSFGGETPYAPALAAMLAGGNEPEIFVFEGYTDYTEARAGGRLTDLSGEPWVADTDVAFVATDGTIVGFPVAIEGWGLGYNAEILRQAGVDPATMTNIAGMRAAFETINNQLDDLGLDAVVSMAASPDMTWVTGLHGFNAYLALGLEEDDRTFIDMLIEGQVDEERLLYFAEYYNLIFQHSVQRNLVTGGYDDQLGDFAVGRTAFIHQGNWVDPTFAELGVTFEMGYVPHAFLPEDTVGIFVGAPSWYLVNAQSANPQAAKDFLNFMASSPEGHEHMVTNSGAVPAFHSVTLVPEGPLSQALNQWAGRGETFPWFQNDMPAGFGMGTLGPIFELMARGDITPAEFVTMVADHAAAIP